MDTQIRSAAFAWLEQLTLIHGDVLAAWPVYIVNDNILDLSFTVAVDDMNYLKKTRELEVAEDPGTHSRRNTSLQKC